MKTNIEICDLDGREARRAADLIGPMAHIGQGHVADRFDVHATVDTFHLVELSKALRSLEEQRAVFA